MKKIHALTATAIMSLGVIGLTGIMVQDDTLLFNDRANAQDLYTVNWTEGPEILENGDMVLKGQEGGEIRVDATGLADIQKDVLSLNPNGTFKNISSLGMPGIGSINSVSLEYTIGDSSTLYDGNGTPVLSLKSGYNTSLENVDPIYGFEEDFQLSKNFNDGNPSYLEFRVIGNQIINISKISISYGCNTHEYINIPQTIEGAETLNYSTKVSEYEVTNLDHAAVINYKNVAANTYATVYTPFNHDVLATNKITMTLINNKDTVANVRIDMQQAPVEGSSKNCINTSAIQDGHPIRTDMEWGGSFVTLNAKQTSTVVINYTKDLLTGMVMFLDSMHGTEAKYSGSITIANVVLTNEGATNPDQGETTTAENISFSSDFAGYQITNNGTSTDVVYTDAKGKTWKCMTTMFENDITTYTTLTLKIKNNGENESNVRIDILNAENKCLNTKATMNDGDVFTDMEWGGSFFVIQAGQEVSISITFTTGSADKVNVFIDSHVNDELLRSGSITVSDFIFA